MTGEPNATKLLYMKYVRTLDSFSPHFSARKLQTPKLYFSTNG